MSRTIGLNSFNLFDEPKFIRVTEEKFTFETLYDIDRTIRDAISTYPTAPWEYVEKSLVSAGFTVVPAPDGDIFWHSRHWNEHLMPRAQSFFVTFPEGAPYELSGEIVLAISYPGIFTIVPAEYFCGEKLLLLNANNEPIYPGDIAWVDENETKKIPLGPINVIKNQFSSELEAQAAQQALRDSGYLVCEEFV